MIDGVVGAWSAGYEARLEGLFNNELREKYPELYHRLIADRNARFADRLATLPKGQGVVFVAIGAAHLVGPDSVQADLAKLGCAAVRQ